MKRSAITAENISIGYKNPIITNLDLNLEEGKVTALLGRNGIGKSTLLKTISKELDYLSGEIKLYGRSLKSYSQKELSKKISIVTTDQINAGGLTAFQIAALGRHPYTGFIGHLSSHDKIIVKEALIKTGIYEKADNFFAHLSDGEKQKVLIARALAQETPIIILDEPFSFLDTSSRIEIMQLLKELASSGNITSLFSSHDVSQALRMADNIWLMTSDGNLLTGTPDEIVATNSIEKMFNNKNIRFDASQADFILNEQKHS